MKSPSPQLSLLALCLLWLPAIAMQGATLPPARFITSFPGVVTIASASGHSANPFFSDDSRYLFFQSTASDLFAEPSHPSRLSLYQYDLKSAHLRKVDAKSGLGRSLYDSWSNPLISADGRIVIFSSLDRALSPLKTNTTASDVFWHHIETGETRLVSVNLDGRSGGNGDSEALGLSENGSVAIFSSTATNLDPLRRSFFRDLFVHDLRSGVKTVLDPEARSMTFTALPNLNAEGTRAAFVRYMPPIDFPQGIVQIVVVDIPSHAVLWASPNLTSPPLSVPRNTYDAVPSMLQPAISRDGNRVAFSAPHGVQSEVWIHDLKTGEDFHLPAALSESKPLPTAPVQLTPDGMTVVVFQHPEAWIQRPPDGPREPLFDGAAAAEWTQLGLEPIALFRDLSQFVFLKQEILNPDLPSFPELWIRERATGFSHRITSQPSGEPGNQATLTSYSVSPDGRWVTFVASDGGLVDEDRNSKLDVFLYEVPTRSLKLISSRALENRTHTTMGRIVGLPSFDKSETTVAFQTSDGNRMNNDTNGSTDVIVRDLVHQSQWSPTLGRMDTTNSYQCPGTIVSSDGKRLLFMKREMLPDGKTEKRALYDVDLVTRETKQIIRGSGPSLPLPEEGYPWLAVDGAANIAVFESSQINGVISEEGTSPAEVFIWSRTTGKVSMLSTNATGEGTKSGPYYPWMSRDGRHLLLQPDLFVFTFPRPQLARQLITHCDLTTGVQNQIETLDSTSYAIPNPGHRVISDITGNLVGFRVHSQQPFQIVVLDLSSKRFRKYAGASSILSLSPNGQFGLIEDPYLTVLAQLDLKNDSRRPITLGDINPAHPDRITPPVLSSDGRFAAFTGIRFTGDTPSLMPIRDVFIHDFTKHQNLLTGRLPLPQPATTHESIRLNWTPEGDVVAVWVENMNGSPITSPLGLTRFDFPMSTDDQDGDGLWDVWENYYFGGLQEDGTMDSDHDGLSNMQEFKAETDPKDPTSRLEIIHPPTPKNPYLEWASVPGRTYRIQVNDKLRPGKWLDDMTVIMATDTVTQFRVWSFRSPTTRFYRVVLVETD